MKNIHEEQGCPKQMVLGSSDPRYCVLLNLAVFLEKWLRDWTGTTSRWLFTDGTTNQTSSEESQEKETERYKVLYAKTLKNILEDNSFFEKSPLAGELRTRSIQKYSATIARKSGVSKDNLDYQARWKSKRMQDNYVGMELSWPDITCASKLCKGGFIIYKPKEGLGLTDDWLSRFIAPATTAAFDEGVGAILGRALLWACMDPNAAESVSPDI